MRQKILDFFDLLFTPTSSFDEDIRSEYRQKKRAEYDANERVKTWVKTELTKSVSIVMKEFAYKHRINLHYEPNMSSYTDIMRRIDSLSSEQINDFFKREVVTMHLKIDFRRNWAVFTINKITLQRDAKTNIQFVSDSKLARNRKIIHVLSY